MRVVRYDVDRGNNDRVMVSFYVEEIRRVLGKEGDGVV